MWNSLLIPSDCKGHWGLMLLGYNFTSVRVIACIKVLANDISFDRNIFSMVQKHLASFPELGVKLI